MMKYYVMDSDERYWTFDTCPVDNPMLEKFCALEMNEISLGKPVSHLWQPFPFKFDEWKSKKKFSDFPFLGLYFKAISAHALEYLHALIAPYVEILPLNVVNCDKKYYGLNPLKFYDIDYRRSDFDLCTSFSDDFELSSIEVHAFSDDLLPEAPIFRVHSNIYISEKFRQIVEKKCLTGLLFEKELKYRTGEYLGKHTYFYDMIIHNGDDVPIEITRYGNDPRYDVPPDTDEFEQIIECYKNAENIKEPTHSQRTPILPDDMAMRFKHYPVESIGPIVSNKMLCEFETHLPRPLPQDYREFLKQCNGGILDERSNAFYVHGIPGLTETRPGDVGFLMSLDSLNPEKNEDEEDLLSQYRFLHTEGVFPHYCLPIGSDYGGNLILLSLGESDYGYIYFWDHELGWSESGSLAPDYSHCYFVARSFTELMDSLHYSP